MICVCAPAIGVPSETFIRRHMCDLLPEHTVAVAGNAGGTHADEWNLRHPALLLDSIAPGDRRNRVLEFWREHSVRVILSEYLDWSLRFLELALDAGIPFLAHAHGYDVSRLLRDERWRAQMSRYNRSNGVVVVSRASAERLISIGIEPGKVHTIPCGVDLPESEPRRDPALHDIRCIAVGRMVPKKAPILLLDAFRRAHCKVGSLTLDYIGSGDSMGDAQDFIHALGLRGAVKLHGTQAATDVSRMMRHADIFVQHSRTAPDGNEEGLPVSILEAMAHALPVVSTTHAGIPDAVIDGHTGFLTPEGDTLAMADSITRLSCDPDLRTRMGLAGRARVRDLYTWDLERRRLLQLPGLSAGFGCSAAI